SELDGGPEVALLDGELFVPPRLIRPDELSFGRFGELHERVGMSRRNSVELPGALEQLTRVLADRLEHQEPPCCEGLEEAPIDERLDSIDLRAGDGPGEIEGETPGEHREATEDGLELRFEQRVAPLDRCT